MQDSKHDASDLVQDLAKFPAPSGAFCMTRHTCDGKKVEFRFRISVLRAFEDMECLRDAQRHAKEFGELQGYGDMYREAQAHELIARCLVAAEPFERQDGTMMWHRIFTSGQQVRENLVASEMAQVLNAYEVIKAKYGAIEQMDSATVDEWIAKLADDMDGGSFLSRLDSTVWGALLLLVSQRLAALDPAVQRLLSSSDNTGESDQASSQEPTGSFTGLPATHVEKDGTRLPQDRVLSSSEASDIAKDLDDQDYGQGD